MQSADFLDSLFMCKKLCFKSLCFVHLTFPFGKLEQISCIRHVINMLLMTCILHSKILRRHREYGEVRTRKLPVNRSLLSRF